METISVNCRRVYNIIGGLDITTKVNYCFKADVFIYANKKYFTQEGLRLKPVGRGYCIMIHSTLIIIMRFILFRFSKVF